MDEQEFLNVVVQAADGSLDEARHAMHSKFERRVATREGVSLEQAHDHVRAVLQTLREAVGNDEFVDVTSQLPNEYVAVVSR